MLDPFYLIVGHVAALELLVPQGVKLVQLRLKDLPEHELRRQKSWVLRWGICMC